MAPSPRYRPEPAFRHGREATTGLLFCNLGTPDAPTTPAVRRYLREFLSDPRVVEIPRLLWLPLLHGIILPLRSSRSAAKYASIWDPKGSPLALWSARQAGLLQDWLDARGHRVMVRHAMRYGTPSIAAELDALKAAGAKRILVLTAYPQYSGTTTASVFDAVGDWARSTRHLADLRLCSRYHDQPAYIDALAARIRDHWAANGQAEHLVLSFHGVPRRTLDLGDPYHCECLKTARLLAERLGLARDRYTVTFQSRFGKAEWLQPYTEPTVRELARKGVRSLDVACPGFTSDCLETLEEIGMEVRDAFLEEGGTEYRYIPCLNDQPAWIDALGQLALDQLAGWPTQDAPDTAALAASAERALALGAEA
ncbi:MULTISPECIES: ferrochelatase [Ramlibacter]|uniref:Ferrochelatase n=1 Tax=Ramlibacter aquaticus TaxID=2780094 RepID=A0ABR9SCI3_9BURK|nr:MULTISPECIES: ferrochelatase [Ramlibacter]MBE7940062.1 ferrochelatase [Ramlibacter aquaticus]